MSKADIVLYGGAAGGGKTALAVGLAGMRHQRSLIMRREATQLGGILDELADVYDTQRKGYSGMTREWKLPPWDGMERKVVLGSCPNPGDEMKYQGRARDFLVLDEAANFLESQARFLFGWVRTTTPGQRTRILLCSNPPTTSEGLWLIEMFAPWLDPKHPNPATPGELRWYTTIGGKDQAVDNGEPIKNPNPVSEADAWIYPKSRTFIPARVTDNKYLGSGYLAELQALPEPLRSQMLYGDFTAGQDDDEYQVIPTDWIREAQARWKPRPFEDISSVGLDPSRGGRDQTVMACRSGWYFHPLKRWEGEDMKTGGQVATKVVEMIGTQHCPVHVDSIGIGSSVVDHLDALIHSRCIPVNVSVASKDTDWAGILHFINKRAWMTWRLRDLLNPANGQNLALPPDQRLLSDLTSYRYKPMANGIKVESKEDIVKRLGRSPDSGDAIILAAEKAPVMQVQGYRKPSVVVKGSL
jgi:hypothetical protein